MLATIVINITHVVVAVLVHYEALHVISRMFRRLFIRHRFGLVLGIGGALCAHALEIWIFAFGCWLSFMFIEMQRFWSDSAGG